jgi:hypothetical protein
LSACYTNFWIILSEEIRKLSNKYPRRSEVASILSAENSFMLFLLDFHLITELKVFVEEPKSLTEQEKNN